VAHRRQAVPVPGRDVCVDAEAAAVVLILVPCGSTTGESAPPPTVRSVASADVVALSGGVPYFWLQPAATVTGAVLVLVAAIVTLRQRAGADRKDQWWKRTQWAFDLLLTRDEDAVVLGLDVLAQQVCAQVADAEDAALVADVLTPWVDSYEER
jgi:hypothetical protein